MLFIYIHELLPNFGCLRWNGSYNLTSEQKFHIGIIIHLYNRTPDFIIKCIA